MRSKYTKVVDAYGCLGILRINAGELVVLYYFTKEYYSIGHYFFTCITTYEYITIYKNDF